MKYMLLINSAPEGEAVEGATFEDWMVYDKSVRESGVYVSGHALADLVTATTVRVGPDGQRAVTTDGPFAETREVLGGYYVIDVPDWSAAQDWAAKIPSAPYGSVEIRPVMVFADAPA